ncbi:unnamed protein product [Lupinus luteus]|uniref:Terpene cyclase/mutase family member n=1 Tax=Lupinus luteus TaxID=3873 RepID=A0AAV1XPK8_LUPLU
MWKLKVSESKEKWNIRSVNNHIGRQFWEFDPDLGTEEERAQVEHVRQQFHNNRFIYKHSSDLLMRLQFEREKGLKEMKVGGNNNVKAEKEIEDISEEVVGRRLKRALRALSAVQSEDGFWPGDYGGPLFLLPALVIGLYVTGALNTILHDEHQREMKRYLFTHQNIDGGWGLHIEGCSTMFCTALSYVSLRLLGEDKDDGAMQNARKWIVDRGGVTSIPSWGKLWLSEDLYYPRPMIQDMLWDFLHYLGEPLLMSWPCSKLRKKALDHVMQHIHYEDENTQYICIGPVNKVLNMVCCWLEDPNSEAYKCHLSRIKDYLWVAEDGMKMQGYNGSQFWDVSFTVQAILSTNMDDEYSSMLKKANHFIKCSQVRRNSSSNPSEWYRHISKGGWPFSTQDNGWAVSDCSAEGLKVAILLSNMPFETVGKAIETEQLYDAVNYILSLQNPSGGFASYELTRSYSWLEKINPTGTFGDIMIDYQYVECTSAVIQGLALFREKCPEHMNMEIQTCIAKAANFIQTIQLPDGSWFVFSLSSPLTSIMLLCVGNMRNESIMVGRGRGESAIPMEHGLELRGS